MQPSERDVLGLHPNGLSAKVLKARCKGMTRGAALQGWQAPGNEFPLGYPSATPTTSGVSRISLLPRPSSVFQRCTRKFGKVRSNM